jgi:hypothetical protein
LVLPGVFLAIYRGEHHVFRAFVLSIVLTLAVGQNATLLCRAWCDPQAAAASGCHHEESTNSPTMGGNSCDHAVLSIGAFLREEVGRAVDAPDAARAIFVPRYQISQSSTDARVAQKPEREWSLEKRPLSTALRI